MNKHPYLIISPSYLYRTVNICLHNYVNIKGYATSTKNIKRLTAKERKLLHFNQEVSEALVGILLSDGHIAQRSPTSNSRFQFTQTGKLEKREYFNEVFNLFKAYCAPNMVPFANT